MPPGRFLGWDIGLDSLGEGCCSGGAGISRGTLVATDCQQDLESFLFLLSVNFDGNGSGAAERQLLAFWITTGRWTGLKVGQAPSLGR